MKTITARHAQINMDRLLEEITRSSEPVRITAKTGNAVLVSEEEWRSLQTPLEECSPGPEFRPRPPLL